MPGGVLSEPVPPNAKLLPMATRANSKSAGQRSLFEQDAPIEASPSARETDYRFGDPHILLGTSAFQANGWAGSFYPKGMKSGDYLAYYASRFRTVEIDSTYYGPPAASTVESWYRKTPSDFVFAAKVPQTITHDKILVGCSAEFAEFVERMDILKEKRGPLLMQFPRFTKFQFKDGIEFLVRLRDFLEEAPKECKQNLVIEIRNPEWLDNMFVAEMREQDITLALTDTSFMPRPWELKKPLDLVTSDFAYVRWLGDRKGIEAQTTTWDKTIVDRKSELNKWAEIIRNLVLEKKLRKIFAFANNHYAGHAPATVKMFWDLWKKK
jgi:uncharacterized protein YecE (DUF72 family)